MIRSWRNAASRRVWDGETPNQFRGLDFAAAVDLLSALNVAKSLQDLIPIRAMFDSSCPRLSRASTSRMMNRIKDMDGRDKPGHDEGEASNIIEGWYYISGPIPKFVSCCRTLVYELRNLRTASTSTILV